MLQTMLKMIKQRMSSLKPFSEAIMALGWVSEEAKLAFVKLLAATTTAAAVAPASVRHAPYAVLTDVEAARLLEAWDATVLTADRALTMIYDVVQKHWLRPTFHLEKLNAAPGINVGHWFRQDEPAVVTRHDALRAMLAPLGFVDAVEYTDQRPPDAILLMGGLQHHIEERLQSLPQVLQSYASMETSFSGHGDVSRGSEQWRQTGLDHGATTTTTEEVKAGEPIDIYYLSGRRGVFNFEPALADMLLEHLQVEPSSAEAAALRQALRDYDGDDKDWRSGSTAAMKAALMQAIGRGGEPWPSFPGFSASAPEDYDEWSQGWPVAADLAQHLLRKMPGIPEWARGRLRIIPVIAPPHPDGRLANTNDTVLRWEKQVGDALVREANVLTTGVARPVVVALSSQPHLLYQTTSMMRILTPDRYTLRVVGTAIRDFQVHRILTEAAKGIHEMRPVAEEFLEDAGFGSQEAHPLLAAAFASFRGVTLSN